jgi:hypothetical protein
VKFSFLCDFLFYCAKITFKIISSPGVVLFRRKTQGANDHFPLFRRIRVAYIPGWRMKWHHLAVFAVFRISVFRVFGCPIWRI